MKSEWRVGQVRHQTPDGVEVVYGIYRLRDAARPDERGNREWLKQNGQWAYCGSREGAQRYVDIFNALDRKNAAPGDGNAGSGKAKL